MRAPWPSRRASIAARIAYAGRQAWRRGNGGPVPCVGQHLSDSELLVARGAGQGLVFCGQILGTGAFCWLKCPLAVTGSPAIMHGRANTAATASEPLSRWPRPWHQ